MKRWIVAFVLFAAPARADAPIVHATASCTPSNKPGRIRCRAVLELPLDRVATTKIAWSEARIVSADPAVTPLRGRLGPLDAETRDDARVVWSFSVASETAGDRSMRVRLLATVEPKGGGAPTMFDQKLDVAVRVAP
jgi:hypothetical protein